MEWGEMGWGGVERHMVADGRAVLLLQLLGARNTDLARHNPKLAPPKLARLEAHLNTLCNERLMQIIRAGAVSQGRPRQLRAILLVKGFRRQSHGPCNKTGDTLIRSGYGCESVISYDDIL